MTATSTLLTVPGGVDALPVLRTIGAHAAAEADLGMDLVADLELAIDEAATMFITQGAGEIQCALAFVPGAVRVRLSTPDLASVAPDELSRLVLEAVAGEVEFDTDEAGASVRFTVAS